MSWNNSLYTNIGTNMMSEVLSGATMTITKAVGGAGTTAAESLAALTDVKDQKQTLKILGIEDATDSTGNDAGKRIKIQITNEDVETGVHPASGRHLCKAGRRQRNPADYYAGRPRRGDSFPRREQRLRD